MGDCDWFKVSCGVLKRMELTCQSPLLLFLLERDTDPPTAGFHLTAPSFVDACPLSSESERQKK